MKPTTIKKNIQSLNIPSTVKLVAVSKTKPIPLIKAAYETGHRIFGESYIQEGIEKIRFMRDYPDIEWHFIGHLQSNKAEEAAQAFDYIQSVDRKKIVRKLNTSCKKIDKDLPVLIQVNIGNEPQKSGVKVSQLEELLAYAKQQSHLIVKGFMCIPPFEENPVPHFDKMAHLFQKYKEQYDLSELSMGMSADYQIAIAHGATMVRVGTAIFGERKTF